MSRIGVVFCLILAVSNVYAHTWLGCTKMVNGVCQGYIRNYKGRNTPIAVDEFYTTKVLGRQTGFNVCSQYQKDKSYTSQYPMAKAYAGETLNVMYTPNGHSQPGDYGLRTTSRIHWTGRTNTQLVTREDLNAANKIGEWNYGSNCAQTGDVASLPCINGFKIPDGTSPGVYQVVWYWPYDSNQAQRPLGEEYFSCFDVEVVGTANTPTSQPAAQPTSQQPTSQRTSDPTSQATSTPGAPPTNTPVSTQNSGSSASGICDNILADCKSFCGDNTPTVCECDPVSGAKKLACGEESSSASTITMGIIPLVAIALINLL